MMTRTRLLAGNWKMHKTRAEAYAFVSEFTRLRSASPSDPTYPELLVCVPFTALTGLREPLEAGGMKLGAQNMHEAERGAFTGEVSAEMLTELGCDYVILGHSERRQYFAESDAAVAIKTLVAFANGMRPLVCVGETLEERERGETAQKISTQVGAVLTALASRPTDAQALVIAYEPIWAIGTGRTASREDAQEVAAAIRAQVREQFGDEAADAVRILYGGSVKPDNIGALLAEADIDGALVGGASLDAESFFKMAENSAL